MAKTPACMAISTMKIKALLLSLLVSSGLFAQATGDTAERLRIADEMENSMQNEMLNKWYPQCMDTTYGGFLSSFTYDFKPTKDQNKFIVTQARHTWSNSKAAMRYPGVPYYRTLASNLNNKQ